MLLTLSWRSFIKIQYSSFPLFRVAYPFRLATHYNITWSASNVSIRITSVNSTNQATRHNSADSVPTSNLVCITEVAIRTTFCIAGIIQYTCYLVTDGQCIRYKNTFNKHF